VCDLVSAHLLEYSPAADIARRQFLEVRVDMAFHLPLGFADETETDCIASDGRCGADGK
jgi:hypothetical protein